MGCGALTCNQNGKYQQLYQMSKRYLRSLSILLKPNKKLVSDELFQQFMRNIQLNINAYSFQIKSSLATADTLSRQLKIKWKMILYGIDSQLEAYKDCIGCQQFIQTYNNKHITFQPKQQTQQNSRENINLQLQKQNNISPTVLPHPAFEQIQKDLDRTFYYPKFKREQFKAILQRIANHFPTMGYTQGINFIVGYLLTMGFNCEDSFWMFVHLSLNRRYMLLGIFEQNFPLSRVYAKIFKNILKRTKKQLYSHLYQNLQMDDSLWILKWFMTFFLYSFPMEIGSYVLDLVVNRGGIGLVYFSLGIVIACENYLMKLNEECQVNIFLNDLKSIEKFNEFIPIKEVVWISYIMEVQPSDVVDVPDDNFYGQYIKQYYLGHNNHINSQNKYINKLDPNQDNCQKLLEEWYHKLLNERQQFIKLNGRQMISSNKIRISLINDKMTKKPKSDVNSNQLDQIQQIQNIIQSSSKKTLGQNHKDFQLKHTISLQQSISEKIKKQDQQYKQNKQGEIMFMRNTEKLRKRNKFSQQIGELWDQQDEQKDRLQEIKIIHNIDINDEQFNNNNNFHENNNFANEVSKRKRRGSKASYSNVPFQVKPSNKIQNHIKVKTEEQQDIYSKQNKKIIMDAHDSISINIDFQQKQSSKGVSPKNHYENHPQYNIGAINKMLMAGKSIISCVSVSNASISNKSDASSRQGNKEIRQKQNGQYATRYCKCPPKNKKQQVYCKCTPKNKKQELKQIYKEYNENEEEQVQNTQIFRYRNSEKNEKLAKKDVGHSDITKIIIQQNDNILLSDDQKKHVTMYQDWKKTSKLNPKLNNSKYPQSLASEVEIFDANQLFKKKNKVSNKIGATIIQNKYHRQHRQEKKKNKQVNRRGINQKIDQQEQSYESIFIQNSSQGQTSRISGVAANNQTFEIESVK